MKQSFVYFIQAGDNGAIKIGVTAGNPLVRMAALQTGCPDTLRLVGYTQGSAQDESDLHQRFAHLRQRGEWFAAEPDLLAFIDGIRFAMRDAPPLEQPTEAHICGLGVEELDRIFAYMSMRMLELRAISAISAVRFNQTTDNIATLRDIHNELMIAVFGSVDDSAVNCAVDLIGRDKLEALFFKVADLDDVVNANCGDSITVESDQDANDEAPEVH